MATKYLVIQGTANSSEEAITLCGEALHKAGIVGEDFGKACVEREKDYPTGTISEVPMKQKDVDVVFTTANYRNPLEKPHLSVFGLVSGIGKDATRKKVADLLQKLAEE